MSIKDVIKQSVYEQFGGGTDLSVKTILLLFLASAVVGIYIYAVYKNQSKTAFYSRDLNMTIAGLPLIVCAIMIAMQSNLIVSLGMVGALSIVRFRNAVKNPLDLLFFFWSISAGIICGVGLVVLAVVLCLAMTGMIILLHFVPNAKASSVVVLRSSQDDVDWNTVLQTLKKNGKAVKEKSRSYRSGQTEIIYEMIPTNRELLVKDLEDYKKIEQINILSHDGEYRV
ncbi:MAG: DUF4956 domain-containing protein [Lachnospiraceae bacterium]|nr:DUF4956 domain-containing protein [Lachnospiraceae bacterium]